MVPTSWGRHDASGTVNVETDIVVIGYGRLTRVHTNPHPDVSSSRPAVVGDSLLHRNRRRNCVGSTGESSKDTVPGALDLNPLVLTDCATKKRELVGQKRDEAAPDPLGKFRRALHICEEKGNRAGGELP